MPRRRGRKRSQYRQQKLSIATVKKVARAVAKQEDRKQEEPKYTKSILGGLPSSLTDRVTECVITRGGLYEVEVNTQGPNLVGIDQTPLLHHPQTYPMADDQGQQQAAVYSGAGTRVGDTIFLKGLGITGYLILGKDCPNAQVHIGIYKADQEILNPERLIPELDGFRLRRELTDFEKMNKTKCGKTWSLNHRSAEDTVKLPVNLYLPVNKRIRYNLKQPSINVQNPMQQFYYADDRYYMVAISDTPMGDVTNGIGQGIPNNQLDQVLDKFPRFYGRYTAYYRDA